MLWWFGLDLGGSEEDPVMSSHLGSVWSFKWENHRIFIVCIVLIYLCVLACFVFLGKESRIKRSVCFGTC